VPKWIKKTVRKIECSNGIEDVAALMDCNLTELKGGHIIITDLKNLIRPATRFCKNNSIDNYIYNN